jgi:UDP-N-acetyl-D-galactosamine dehydrogenase
VKLMIKKGIAIKGATLLILGITFKENCPDVRNTKIVDVVAALEEYGIKVTIYDPWANPAEVMHEYNLTCHAELPNCHSELISESKSNPLSFTLHTTPKKYNAIVLGVAHKEFLDLNLNELKEEKAVIYDVKGILPNEIVNEVL